MTDAAHPTPPPAEVTPSVGLGVLHLFCSPGPLADAAAVLAAVEAARAAGTQVVTAALLGHKADLAVMALHPDLWRLRELQTALVGAGLEVADSYVSLTEVSEYADGVPEKMKQARLHPELPPEDRPVFGFYPMSKRRHPQANWFTLPFEERKELMHEHGASGREFAGRVVQVVTGSTGLDDFEWGVTLFCARPDDLKAVVYTLRYDRASARYGDFGPFYTGMVAEPAEALARIGLA